MTAIAKIREARKDGITRARLASILDCSVGAVDGALRRGELSEEMEARVNKLLTAAAIKRSENVKDPGGQSSNSAPRPKKTKKTAPKKKAKAKTAKPRKPKTETIETPPAA